MGPCWRPDTEARVLGFLAPGHFEPSYALCSTVRSLPCTRSPGWLTVGFRAGFQGWIPGLHGQVWFGCTWLPSGVLVLSLECFWGLNCELREGVLSRPFPRADCPGIEVRTGTCFKESWVSLPWHPGDHLAGLWSQKVSLRYKRAVCLELKFVVVFFCPNWSET